MRTPLISREEQLLGVRELGEHLPLTATLPGCRKCGAEGSRVYQCQSSAL